MEFRHLFLVTFLFTTESVNGLVNELPGVGDSSFLEKKLVKYLLSLQDGSELGRPVSHFREAVDVAFGINLMQVQRVDEDAGQLITNLWTHYKWHDPSLAWNRSVIEVDVVRVPAEQIWTPDIVLSNYADSRMRQARSTLAVVNSSGHIDWIPTGIFKSACSIDTYPFPFDEQVCHMTFRSLSMGIHLMTLDFVDNRRSMSMDSYVENPEWEIIENTAFRTNKTEHRGMSTTYYDLTFTLRLKRRSIFHRYVLVLPCILLSLTAGVLFMLPPESPAKIQIGIFIFQAFFLLLNLLKNSTPPSGSSNPIIGTYYSSSMIATTIVMFSCGYLVELHFRAHHKSPMSDFLRSFVIKRLARFLLIPVPNKNPLKMRRQQKFIETLMMATRAAQAVAGFEPEDSISAEDRDGTTSNAGRRKSLFTLPIRRLSVWRKSVSSDKQSQQPSQANTEKSQLSEVLGDLVDLRKMFQRIVDKQANKEYMNLVKQEWQIAIIVFDRVFFFAYIVYIVVSLTLLLREENV